jgi:hypothetical protein
VEVELVWWLRQVNAVLDFKVTTHSGLTIEYTDRHSTPGLIESWRVILACVPLLVNAIHSAAPGSKNCDILLFLVWNGKYG